MPLSKKETVAGSALAALLYYDIFNHPVTLDEAFAFMPTNSVTVGDVRDAVAEDPRITKKQWKDREMLLLRGKGDEVLAVRGEKELHAQTLWKRADMVARFIAMFPFVRALFISGSLSKNAVARGGDIDWFIITEPGRLWICKAALTFFRRVFLFNDTTYFCTNYYISADALEIPDKNVFVATEIATAQPVLNAALCARFQEANTWVKRFLPNVSVRGSERVVSGKIAAVIRSSTEVFFRGRVGDFLEKKFHEMHVKHFIRRHGAVPQKDFELMYRARQNMCKIHHQNFQRRVLDEYGRRLREHGLTRTLEDTTQE
jgi:hypothetical protein